MIKLIIFSFKKSQLLSQIAKESKRINSVSTNSSNITIPNKSDVKSVNKFEFYVDKLFSLLLKDEQTTSMLVESGRNVDDLRKIIKKLEIIGAKQIVNGHYVPVSSIAFLKQLKIILSHWNGENFMIGDYDARNSNMKIAYQLIKSFE